MAETRQSLYSMHPAYAMEEAYRRNLLERTGKSIQEWAALTIANGPPTEKERREWLKREHGLSTNYAWWVAEVAGRGGEEAPYDPEALVEAMFSGPREALRPIYEALLHLGLSLGPDVRACPCQTIVPLYRRHVFAQIKPATRTRIDFGFALADTPAAGRLMDTGGFAKKDRITHRIPITSVEEIDDEVRRWLRTAYDMDAPAPPARRERG